MGYFINTRLNVTSSQRGYLNMFDFKPSWTNLAFLFIDTFTFFDVVS